MLFPRVQKQGVGLAAKEMDVSGFISVQVISQCPHQALAFAKCWQGKLINTLQTDTPSGVKTETPAVGQNQWYHFWVGAPPMLEPILVGIGMFTGGYDLAFDPMAKWLSTTAPSRRGWCGHLQ